MYEINGVDINSFDALKRWTNLYRRSGLNTFTVNVKGRKYHFSRHVAHQLQLTDAIAAPEAKDLWDEAYDLACQRAREEGDVDPERDYDLFEKWVQEYYEDLRK